VVYSKYSGIRVNGDFTMQILKLIQFFLIFSSFIISSSNKLLAISTSTISLKESHTLLLDDSVKLKLKERILSKQDSAEDKDPNRRKPAIKIASSPRLGPVTMKIDINPLNINRNQASLNLELVESFDILTNKKEFSYDTVDLKKLKRYISIDEVSSQVNSLVDTIKDEFSPVE